MEPDEGGHEEELDASDHVVAVLILVALFLLAGAFGCWVTGYPDMTNRILLLLIPVCLGGLVVWLVMLIVENFKRN